MLCDVSTPSTGVQNMCTLYEVSRAGEETEMCLAFTLVTRMYVYV